ncbi:MAG: alpha/beta hydrolase domain-containing protein [Thermoleophilia bacterium]
MQADLHPSRAVVEPARPGAVARRGRTPLALAIAVLAALVGAVSVAGAAVPDPTVTGPIPATVAPGDPARDYPYFATQFDLASRGYVEQEFFLSGTASTYAVATGQLTTATVVDGGHPYATRMVVRRPADPKRFNGTVIVEWYNVTVGFDVEANWFRYHDAIVRAGYAWVGVSAQRVGVNALRAWSPARYGALDVTDGGTITNDASRGTSTPRPSRRSSIPPASGRSGTSGSSA